MVVFGLAVPVAAFAAANWDPTKNRDHVAAGAACEDGDAGAWYHFVNNQTGGALTGQLTVTFANPSGPILPSNSVGRLR